MHEQSQIHAIEKTKSKEEVKHVFDTREGLERCLGALAALAEALGLVPMTTWLLTTWGL